MKRTRLNTKNNVLRAGLLVTCLMLPAGGPPRASAQGGQAKPAGKSKKKPAKKPTKKKEASTTSVTPPTSESVGTSNTALTEHVYLKPAKLLSQSGIYSDFAKREYDTQRLIEFTPNYKLWSDGAKKRRFLFLPKGTQINTKSMKEWAFPPHTMFVKEFKSPSGKYLEHRITIVLGHGKVFLGTYVWNQAQTDAVLDSTGPYLEDRKWDTPSQTECHSCHDGAKSRVLGLSAIQVTATFLKQLAATGRLSNPPKSTSGFPVPGTTEERRALGYLHANCGHCHNLKEGMVAGIGLDFNVAPGAKSVEDTGTYRTAVRVKRGWGEYSGKPFERLVSPGNPDASAIPYRMGAVGKHRMPEIGSDVVDPDGVATITAWIAKMPPAGTMSAVRTSPTAESSDGDGVVGGLACTPVINELQILGKKGPREFVELYNPCGFDFTFTKDWELSINYESSKSAESAARVVRLAALGGHTVAKGKYLVFTGKGVTLKDKKNVYSLPGSMNGILNTPAGTITLSRGLEKADSVSWGTGDYPQTRSGAALPAPRGRSLARHWRGERTGRSHKDFTPRPPTPGASNVPKKKPKKK